MLKPLVPLVALLTAACTGTISDERSAGTGPGPGTGGAAAGVAGASAGSATVGAPSKVVMRRLTRREYDNTVRDLLGVTETPAISSFPPEETAFHFDNNGEALAFPPTLAERALAAAATLAKVVATGSDRFAPCATTSKDDACASFVLESFARRAFRRPLEAPELDRLLGVYRQGASRGFEYGLELAATTVLISLPFFYRIERGDGIEVAGKPGWVRPTSWEMASRLSYLLLGSTPDSELVAAAEAGRLSEPKDIEAQARRLLATARAKESVAHFHRQWLRLDGIASAAKDPALFPAYTGDTPGALRREADLFLEAVAFGGGGFKDLMTGAFGFVSPQTALLYGVTPPGGNGSELLRAAFDPAQRSGFLTLAGTMAMLSDFGKTSPIRRGVFVRENLLCSTLPPPPPGAAATTPSAQPGLSRREQVALHSSDPACAGCHRLIDPIGLAFESYDAAGQWRSTEEGEPIDVSGNALDTSIGEFSGAVELARRIAESPEGQGCFARQLFRFAMGRGEAGSERDLDRLAALVHDHTGDYSEIMVQLTQSDAFLYMPKPEMLP